MKITPEQLNYRILFSKIATIALLVAVIPIWPYFFYQFLKLAIFVCWRLFRSSISQGKKYKVDDDYDSDCYYFQSD